MSTRSVRPNQLAVLGLLAERPNHPYALHAEVRRRRLPEWAHVAFSSIYPLLAGLERQGLVVAEPGPADAGPERILYSLTTAGRAALAAAVRDAIGGPPGDRPGMQLALMFRHVLSAEELVALFQRRSTAIDAELDRTQRERSSLGPWQEYAGLIFDHQRLHLVAEQEFLRIAIARIGAAGWKPGAWKPGG